MNSIVKHEGFIDEIGRTAKMLAMSQFFTSGCNDVEVAKLAVQILAGREMDLGPFAAVQSIHIIKGRPALAANLMAAKVKGSAKYDYRVQKMEDDEVAIEFFQGGESLGVSRFTAEDARRAGTQNMGKYPRNMLFARAMSNGVRWYCPDVFNGNAVYVPEELQSGDSGNGFAVVEPEGDEESQHPPEYIDGDLPSNMGEVEELSPDGRDTDAEFAAIPGATDPVDYGAIADSLTGTCKSLAEKAFDAHINGAGPASDAQYKFLAGTLNKLTDGKHTYVLSVLCRREVSSESPCSRDLAKKLLDYCLETKPQTDERGNKVVGEDGKVVYVKSEAYSQAVVDCLKAIAKGGDAS